jgi:3-hydroxyisobutyrate dehydrogenase-like beta-hydroxyacid dehydrogenase
VTAVGLVGTGRMGSAMTGALRAAGHDVILYNRTLERARALAGQLDCTVGRSPADVAAGADVVLTMLADDAAVEDVYAGPDGLLAGARPGNVLVDLSTVTPDTIRSFEARARDAGAGILDSPVSGSVSLAGSGQLTLMVGGTAEDLERARPVLESLAKTIVHVGPLGAGAAMKLAVNTVIFGLNEALAEGLVLAEAAGIDREVAYGVLADSAVGAPYVGYKRAAFLDPDGTPVAFALDLAAKDLGLIRVLADRVGLDLPQSRVNLDAIRAASAAVGGGSDFSSVATHLRNERRTVTQEAAGGR